jgi:hypothetical protein
MTKVTNGCENVYLLILSNRSVGEKNWNYTP